LKSGKETKAEKEKKKETQKKFKDLLELVKNSI
jgi:hypothetical protein